MPDSPMMYVGPRRRKSFLGEDEQDYEDPEMYEWAKENNKLPVTKGSTIVKIVDPVTKEVKYVGRRNDDTGISGGLAKGTTVGMPTDDGDQLGEVMVSSKNKVPSFLSRGRARALSGAYNKENADRQQAIDKANADNDRRQMEAEAEAKKIAEEERQDERARKSPAGMIANAQAQMAVASMSEMAEKKNKRETRKTAALSGADIKGYSRNAEEQIRQALEQGVDVDEAYAVGANAHRKDVARLTELETSGSRADFERAKAMREGDSDLAAVESFVRPRDPEAEQRALRKVGDPAFSKIRETGDASSWFSDAPDWASLSPEEQDSMRKDAMSAVDALLESFPGMTESEAKQKLADYLEKRGLYVGYTSSILGS